MKHFIILSLFVIGLFSCNSNSQPESVSADNIFVGEVNRYSEAADLLIPEDARPQVIAEGFSWSEGPLWSDDLNGLLFSDVPHNKVYLWTEEEALRVYLEPSGYTGEGWAEGSNGLAISDEGELIICQHGDRQIARMNTEMDNPTSDFSGFVTNVDGKRFNSPNDLTLSSSGSIYFTDPPYGLPGKDEDESKELDYNGVFLWKDGEVRLLVDSMTRPNGIGLSPDESTLYVANSDGEHAYWASYALDSMGNVVSGKYFKDVTDKIETSVGKPDGLKVHPDGWIFASGPGGVYIMDKDAKLHALIDTDGFVSNVAFNSDFTMLYMTVANRIMRIPVNSQNY